MPTATLNEQLDKLESNLPAVSARVLHLQRTIACAAYDRTAAIVTTVAQNTMAFLDTARTSGKTVTGQARAAGTDVLNTASTGAKTVAGQARAAGSDVLNTASTRSVPEAATRSVRAGAAPAGGAGGTPPAPLTTPPPHRARSPSHRPR